MKFADKEWAIPSNLNTCQYLQSGSLIFLQIEKDFKIRGWDKSFKRKIYRQLPAQS